MLKYKQELIYIKNNQNRRKGVIMDGTFEALYISSLINIKASVRGSDEYT